MTPAEFVRARLGDAEVDARAGFHHWSGCGAPRGEDCNCTDSLGVHNRRWLARVEAHRWIVDAMTRYRSHEAVPQNTIRALAAIWADHPDFQPEWRLPS